MSSTSSPSPSANSSSESSLPPTIIGSFEKKLYVLELEENVTVKTVQASGVTTKNTPPPKLLFYSPMIEFVEYADHFLKHPRLTEKLLDSRTISAKRPEIKQDNEAGVVLTSMTYILDPITEVLHAMFPGKWDLHSEQTQVEKKVEKNIQKEVGGESALRTDLIFKISGSEHTIAVVEFKRRQYIRYKDFKGAIVPLDISENELEQKKLDSDAKNRKTLLEGNAEPYGKQVKAYAIRTGCKHVALFNWEHLLLFNFDPVTFETASDRPKVSWVHEGDDGHGFMEEGLIRKVLLGWLIKAFRDAGIEIEFKE